MEIVEVLPAGTEVEIINLQKIGFITGVYIKNDDVSYDVAIWDDNKRVCYNVYPFEIKTGSEKRQKIGYTNNEEEKNG